MRDALLHFAQGLIYKNKNDIHPFIRYLEHLDVTRHTFVSLFHGGFARFCRHRFETGKCNAIVISLNRAELIEPCLHADLEQIDAGDFKCILGRETSLNYF